MYFASSRALYRVVHFADPLCFRGAADNNQLAALEPGGAMARLAILRVSGNRLQQLDGAPFPNLRTLYADNNCLGPVLRAHRMPKLDNLSLRNQHGRGGL